MLGILGRHALTPEVVAEERPHGRLARIQVCILNNGGCVIQHKVALEAVGVHQNGCMIVRVQQVSVDWDGFSTKRNGFQANNKTKVTSYRPAIAVSTHEAASDLRSTSILRCGSLEKESQQQRKWSCVAHG